MNRRQAESAIAVLDLIVDHLKTRYAIQPQQTLNSGVMDALKAFAARETLLRGERDRVGVLKRMAERDREYGLDELDQILY